MTPQIQQVLALNSYARGGRHIDESWASTDFKATYALVLVMLKPEVEVSMGVHIHWYHGTPERLSVTRTSLVTERTDFSRELPLEGALLETLINDLREIAVRRAAVDIQLERDKALLDQAKGRVLGLMADAARPKEPADA